MREFNLPDKTWNELRVLRVTAAADAVERVAPTAWLWDVIWPASSVDGAIAMFNGTWGKTLKDWSSSPITFNGTADRTIQVARNTTADTVGKSLNINSGSATSWATDKNCWAILLNCWVGTGYGGWTVFNLKIPQNNALTSGTADQSLINAITIWNSATWLYSGKFTFNSFTSEVAAGSSYQYNINSTVNPLTNSAITYRNFGIEQIINPATTVTLSNTYAGFTRNTIWWTADANLWTIYWLAVTSLNVSSSSYASVTCANSIWLIVSAGSLSSWASTVNVVSIISGIQITATAAAYTSDIHYWLQVFAPASTVTTSAYGMDVAAIAKWWTNTIGLRIAAPTSSASGIKVALQLSGTTGTQEAGILFGTDTYLRRSGANSLAILGTAAGQFAMARHTTADTAGNNLNVQAGGATSGATDKNGGIASVTPWISTGTGMASARFQRRDRASSTGTTDNAAIDAFIIPSGKNLTDEWANNLFEVALPTLQTAGGTIQYTIKATDGTDMQAVSGVVAYQAVNKGGVYTSSIADIGTPAAAVSTGTLTAAWSIVTGSNKITIAVTPTSSLVPTTLKVYYTIHNGSNQAITQL